MASFSPGTGHQICGPIAHYEPQGVFPSGECVGGLWASLMAEKRHRRGMARSSCPMATLVSVDVACLCDLSYTTVLKDAEAKELQCGLKGTRDRANNRAAVHQWLFNRKASGKKWTEAAEILLAYLG